MLTIFSFVLGSALGSFANVCIYRLPRGLSIVRPGSRCTFCGHEIRWYQNIPLISYIFLKGRCSNCRAAISLSYPLVELATGLLFSIVFILFDLKGLTFVYWALTVCLVIVFMIDLRHQIIPDEISLPLVCLGFVLSIAGMTRVTWLQSLLGILVGGGILLAIAILYQLATGIEGMGGGDIKLMAAVGAFFGWKGAILGIILGCIMGTMVGVPMVVISKLRTRKAGVKGILRLKGARSGISNRHPFYAGRIASNGHGVKKRIAERPKSPYYQSKPMLLHGMDRIYHRGVRLVRLRLRETTFRTPIPFGPYLVVATFIVMFTGDALIDWYFGLYRLP